MNGALVFWFTGLSGSGKTSITDRLVDTLRDEGKRVGVFDGDVVRSEINKHLGFTPDDIRENNRIIADLCVRDKDKYDYIFVPVISPFEDSRERARQFIGGTFSLVYCNATLEEVIRRDTKGLYRKALSGEMKNFIGVDPNVPYQPPANADLVLNTGSESIDACLSTFLQFIHLREKNFLAKNE
jgi:adenylylsulfate kinase